MENNKLTKEHIEEIIIDAKNKLLESIIQEENENITINWKSFEDYACKCLLNDDENCAKIWTKLLDRGILTEGNPGDYGLLRGDKLLCPLGYHRILYFARREDALDFKEQTYPESFSRITIIRLEGC